MVVVCLRVKRRSHSQSLSWRRTLPATTGCEQTCCTEERVCTADSNSPRPCKFQRRTV